MKAVILAGGLGTRLSEETDLMPKPMVQIGGKPILWHIMKTYSVHGVNDFVICCSYKGYVIKEYFANYFLHMSDVTFDMSTNNMEVHQRNAEPWADLAHLVRDLIAPNKPVRILGKANPSHARNRYVPDITKARRELGLDVTISLAQSIRRSADAHRRLCPLPLI